MLPANYEDTVSKLRANTRQDKQVPFLIRNDGMLFPNVPLIAKKQNMRPYHGDVKASLEERLEYLKGHRSQRRVINTAEASDDEAPLDINKASKEELILFAAEELGLTFEPDTHLNRVRADVVKALKAMGRLPSEPAKPAAGGLS